MAAPKGSTISVSELFDRADELNAEKRDVLDAILATRDTLRNLDVAGLLSDDESAKLSDMFPVVTRTRSGNGSTSTPE